MHSINHRTDRIGMKHFNAGFTMLEILIAISIFAIIMTTIFGSHNFLFSKTESLNRDISNYEMAATCLNQMVLDLRSVYVSIPPAYSPPDIDSPPEPYRFFAESSAVSTDSFPKLRFASFSHLPFEKNATQGITEIVYYVRPNGMNGFVLKRSDRLFPNEPFTEKESDPVLCENLKSLTYAFLDAEGSEHDHWDSETDDFKFMTPRAVAIKIELIGSSSTTVFETKVALPVYREKTG